MLTSNLTEDWFRSVVLTIASMLLPWLVSPEFGFELFLNVKNLAHEKGTLPTELHVKSDMCTVTEAQLVWYV